MVKNIDTTCDWLNLFTKASERVCLAFIVEMPKSKAERVERRRLTRIKRRAVERLDLFKNDYIKHKYPGIDAEATRVCELLNNKYPNKFDLRKTPEHREWKTKGTAQTHPILNTQQPIYIPLDAQIVVTCEPPCPELPNTESTSCPELPNTESTSCPKLPNTESTSCPELPNIEPTNPELLPSPEPPSSPDPPSSPEPPPTPGKFLNDIEKRTGKRMELRIPLMESPRVTTETLQTITEEVLQEGNTLLPLCEEIDPEAFEKIINELRADPDLGGIFADIEEQVEFEELGMNLEIPEDSNTLEKELENWEFW